MRKIFTLLVSGAFAACGMAQDPLLSVTFDANGPVLGGTAATEGTHELTTASSSTDSAVTTAKTLCAANGTWIGATNAGSSTYGVYKVTYNSDDAVGTAFANAATWEILVSLQHKVCPGSEDDGKGVAKFFSSQQSGGWTLRNKNGKDLQFAYVDADGKESMVSGGDEARLQTGKYYHIMVTADQTTKKLILYVNGKKISDASISTNAYKQCNIGTPAGKVGIPFCLGADPKKVDVYESYVRANFVFANIYEGALTEAQVADLYNQDKVKYFTEAKKPNTTDLILDAVFGKGGNVTDASAYKATVGTAGTVTTEYNADQKRYEINSAEANNSNFFYRTFGGDPSVQAQLSDAYSFEVYMKSAAALPTTLMSALSAEQDGGFGLEFRTDGVVRGNSSTYGYLSSTSKPGTISLRTDAAANTLDTEWTHYVYTVDRKAMKSVLYKNGASIVETTDADGNDAALQSLKFSYAPYQWFCINGDPSSVEDMSTCDKPFQGEISIARVWGKALTAGDVGVLYNAAMTTQYSGELKAKGTAVCLPYAVTLPDGVDAYVAKVGSSGKVELEKYAEAGNVIPYGTPVILKPRNGAITTTLYAADLSTATVEDAPAENLLEGSFAFKVASENEVYTYDNGGFSVAEAGNVEAFSAWLPYADKNGKPYDLSSSIIIGVDKVVKENTGASKAYNLQGQPVNEETYKGIIIKDGKKYLNK